MAPFLTVFMDILEASEHGILHLADADQQQSFLMSLGSNAQGSNIPTSEGHPVLQTSALSRVNGSREGILTA